MSHDSKSRASLPEFDPLAYIENAFSDSKETLSARNSRATEEAHTNGKGHPGGAAVLDEPTAPKMRFRKRSLSAPRPRKAKQPQPDAINDDLKEVWDALPRNIQFLGSFFDDSVTANYYRGEFRETREDLIRRLLDPELSLEEVSRLLGVCPATVRRYTNRGWLGHHRTQGGQRRFRLSGVVKFVEHHGRHPED